MYILPSHELEKQAKKPFMTQGQGNFMPYPVAPLSWLRQSLMILQVNRDGTRTKPASIGSLLVWATRGSL